LVRENARLREALTRKDQELERMQQGEDELKKALMTIQQIREDWIGRAEKQAEQVVLESTLKANQLQAEAEHRLQELQLQVQELRRQKRQLVSEIRHIVEEHLRVLETLAEQDEDASAQLPPLLETSEPQSDVSRTERG
jgi:hypothetical protein